MRLPKIYYRSDLHVDIIGDGYQVTPPDDAKESIMVLAGDINTGEYGMAALLLLVAVYEWHAEHYKEVVVVFGNHDFYGNFIEDFAEWIVEALDEKKLHNVHVLTADTPYITLDGYNFWGDTLWSSLAHKASDIMYHLQLQFYIADFRNIKVSSQPLIRKFHPTDMIALHKSSFDKMIAFLSTSLPNKVVVTHFPPSKYSIHDKYKSNELGLNEYFVNNYEEIIIEYKPLAWIHGHVHNSFYYMLAGTHVVCNPCGYSGENPKYNPHAFISPL